MTQAASAPRVRTRAAPAAEQAPVLHGNTPVIDRSPFHERGELAQVMRNAARAHGDEAIWVASRRPPFMHVPCGIFMLDYAMLGGFPCGLATKLLGWKSSGKTSIALRAVAGFQRRWPDKAAAYVDLDGTLDTNWAAKHGVDTDRLLLIQPTSAEQGLNIADAVIRAQETSVMVVDSLAGCNPSKEIEGDVEDHNPGRRAQMIRKFLNKMQQAMIEERKRDHWPALILINEWTYQIGKAYGDPRVEVGGTKSDYFPSIIIEAKNKEAVVEGPGVKTVAARNHDQAQRDTDLVQTNEHTLVVKKNKLGNSIRIAVFEMVRNPYHPLGEGFIDDAATVLTEAKKRGMVTGGGGHFRLVGVEGHTFRNLDEMVAYCYSDLDYFEQLKLAIINEHRRVIGLPDLVDCYGPRMAA